MAIKPLQALLVIMLSLQEPLQAISLVAQKMVLAPMVIFMVMAPKNLAVLIKTQRALSVVPMVQKSN